MVRGLSIVKTAGACAAVAAGAAHFALASQQTYEERGTAAAEREFNSETGRTNEENRDDAATTEQQVTE